jgi:hypothetical protein
VKLGEIDAETYVVKGVGAIHMARWMGTIIAGLKADLLFKHVPGHVMTAEDLKKLQRINKLMVHVLLRFWFQATLAADAPFNTLELCQELNAYRRVDKELAEVCLAKVKKHAWFDAEEFIPFGLASDKVSAEEKAAIAARLLEQPKDQLRPGPPVMLTITPTTTLSLLIGPQSWHFFDRLGISSDFLSEPVATWASIPAFTKFENFVDNVHIVNDIAERLVKRASDYASLHGKGEAQFQATLQTVERAIERRPDRRTKAALKASLEKCL